MLRKKPLRINGIQEELNACMQSCVDTYINTANPSAANYGICANTCLDEANAAQLYPPVTLPALWTPPTKEGQQFQTAGFGIDPKLLLPLAIGVAGYYYFTK